MAVSGSNGVETPAEAVQICLDRVGRIDLARSFELQARWRRSACLDRIERGSQHRAQQAHEPTMFAL